MSGRCSKVTPAANPAESWRERFKKRRRSSLDGMPQIISQYNGLVKRLCLAALLITGCGIGLAETYEVGPGKAYERIGQAPWATLAPGDTVLIHWRPEPYREKWVICRQGAEDAPITVRGLRGPDGQFPVIDGDGALTGDGLNYWNEPRGIVKVGGANVPPDTMPRHIVIEDLEIRGARPPYRFTDRYGALQTYADNAAAIYVEKAERLTIRNCILHDAGNGLFIGSGGGANVTRDLVVEGNYIFDNGIDDSAYHHNSYTEALGITFQFNRYGPPRARARGNNLKDRSAGLVVRYNWIEGGNRQLDLVDAGARDLVASPEYRLTQVYGNVLIETPDAGNRQIVHYGGDSESQSNYRKGTLLFYHNTVVSWRTDRTTLFRLSTNDERCDARNNVFYVSAPGRTLSVTDSSGRLEFSHNWLKPAWAVTFDQLRGAFHQDGTDIEGDEPGFRDALLQDFGLAAGSAAIDAAGPLAPDAQELRIQYCRHQGAEERPNDGRPDLGAFEFAPSAVAARSRTGTPVAATSRSRGGAMIGLFRK